jgi:hypothetical protein
MPEARYIRDLLDLPAQVNKGDFVLNLARGVDAEHAADTLRNYVVTPQLASCFDQALGTIQGALAGDASKACYLHGSFGSGKSHFMAVLHLLLQGTPAARSIPELAAVVAKHNAWTQGHKFLMVPFHMIGCLNLEQGILGRYAEYVRQLHPQAPVPGVYLAQSLFEDAASLRQELGDAAFFAKLNAGLPAKGGGWGKLAAGWDAVSYEAATAAPPEDPQRVRLVGQLVQAFFRSYHNVAAGQHEAFLDLDRGLAVVAQHAQALGYDGLVLFLDELILWLASNAADLGFIHRETQKLVKLVESQNATRPIPIISFVARQRDLRKLIGDTVPGAQQVNYADSVDWSEGRFGVIKLEDRNLPVIANRRVLQPRSEAARQELEAAFAGTATIRKEVMDTLLANEYDREVFRLIYPFSPALMATLVAASGMLQRERTALKVMLQLLVEQRDTLKVGDIVPVGDLYDVVAQGDEAFSQEMKVHFDNARRLYHEKLLPVLESRHGAPREELLARPLADPVRVNFVNDDRLVKTLLMAALVPGVSSLRNLTAARLAALNHGTIRSPIPGREAAAVLQRCREWQTQVGELKIGDDPVNPVISLQLSGVDTESILKAAQQEDNLGNQIRMVKAILFKELEIADTDELFLTYGFPWRNTERECEFIYGNVRTLGDVSFAPSGSSWKVVVDYPLDEDNRTTRDDISRLQVYQQSNPKGMRTLVWLPAFFSAPARRDLSQLVVIDHVLAGERFENYARALSPQDRSTARTLLENQCSALRERVRQHVEAAYGVRGSQSTAVDSSHSLEDTFRSLMPGLTLQPPAASNLKGAFLECLNQALTFDFPAHPDFAAEIKPTHLRKVGDEVMRAVAEKDGWVLVDKALRPLLKGIAEPLELGVQGETHFVLGQHWKEHFHRKVAEPSATMTVQALRRWLDEPQPLGLQQECGNLVITVFAAQTNRSFHRHGAPFEPSLSNLPDDVELKQEVLPPETVWTSARERAGHIFGLSPSPLLNATNLARLASDVQAQEAACQGKCRELLQRLGQILADQEIDLATANRQQTAAAVVELLGAVREATPDGVIQALAGCEPRTSAPAMGTSLSSAAGVVAALASTKWQLFEAVRALQDDRQAAAQAILQRLAEALRADEHVMPLASALDRETDNAIRLLTPAKPPKPPDPKRETKTARKTVVTGGRQGLSPEAATAEIRRLGRELPAGQKLVIDISWRIEG